MDTLLKTAYYADHFRSQGHAVIDIIADYLAQAIGDKPEMRTMPWQPPEQQLDDWRQDFNSPALADPVTLLKTVMDRSIKVHSKRYLGHQTTPALPITVLSSAVMTILNQGMGVYEMGMAGNAMERILTEHLAAKLGFDGKASGFITSGGSLGNLTALLAARAASTDVWHRGHDKRQRLAVLVSEEAHYCIDRAVRIMGWGDGGIVKVPVNEKFQMRTELLEEYYRQTVAEGRQVVAVIGCAGSTSTGSYDDLDAIADFCEAHKLWFHVDGAHGAPAAFSPRYRHLVRGIEKADSVVVDYHKMMMTPSLATAVIFKRGGDAYRTFAQRAQYLWTDQGTEEWYNSGKRTFECTKVMTALNVYTIFRVYGEDIFRQNVEYLYGLAEQFAALIRSNSKLELAYDPQANIVCFRFKAAAGDLNALNRSLRHRLMEGGRFYVVQTTLRGDHYLRVSLMNPLTTVQELKALLEEVEQSV